MKRELAGHAHLRQQECMRMISRFRLAAALVVLPVLSLPLFARGQGDLAPSVTGAVPPKTWVDKDTGHRVWRVSDVPQSGAYYFNVNAYTPDNKQMVYNSPAGITVLDLATLKSTVLIPAPPRPADGGGGGRGFGGGGARAIVVGHKTNSVFFTKMDPDTHVNGVYKADTNTGAIRKLIDLPPRVSIS